MNTRTKGFLATVVSATFFGFIPLMVKVVCSGGGNTLAAAFYRFALSLPALYIYLKVKKIPMRITKTQLRDIVLITVLGYGGTTLILFSSYNYIPLGMATTIHFTYPVFTILGCVIFLHEKIKKMKVLAVALSFGGILFFYNADGSVSLRGGTCFRIGDDLCVLHDLSQGKQSQGHGFGEAYFLPEHGRRGDDGSGGAYSR